MGETITKTVKEIGHGYKVKVSQTKYTKTEGSRYDDKKETEIELSGNTNTFVENTEELNTALNLIKDKINQEI